MLYKSLAKLKTLPDSVLVFPSHGKGSPCGKNIQSGDFSTIGEQKKTNYALDYNLSEKEFVSIVSSNINKAPQYFSHDVLMNKSQIEGKF